MSKKNQSIGSKAIPESLKKRGITTVTDNLKPGDQVRWPKFFLRIFRTEIEQRIFSPKIKSEDAKSDD